MYVDAHLHLDMFEPRELAAVVQRAEAAGVGLLITTAMDLESSRQTVRIAERFPHVYGAVGIHPWLAGELTPDMLAEFRRLAASAKVVGIGEIGLDFGPRNPDRKAQETVFRGLIGVARESGKRLIIHARQAPEETVRICHDENVATIGGQIHEFTPNDAFIDAFLELGFCIDAGRSLLGDGPETAQLREIVRRIPLDRLLLETDAAPAYDRGHRVEPADVTAVAAAVAGLKGVSAQEVGAATVANAQRLFQISE